MANHTKYVEGYENEGWQILTVIEGNKKLFELGCIHCGHRKWMSYGSYKNCVGMCKCQKCLIKDSPVMPSPLMKASSYADGVRVNTANGTIIVYKGWWYMEEDLKHYINVMSKEG